jgi:hypothetical protein
VDAADFDGTNDYMTRGADLSGSADSKTGTLSLWLRLDGGDGAIGVLIGSATTLAGGTPRFRISRTAANKVNVVGASSAAATVLSLISTSTYLAGATWLHILSSWDLAAGVGHLYINDVDESDTGSDILTDAELDYTVADWSIGGLPDGSAKCNGCLADVYFAPGRYLDFSNVYFRRKFISALGKPVHLGTSGALPSGTAPLIYQHLDDAEAVASFATNRGTGGDFTITGTLATGSTSPSD